MSDFSSSSNSSSSSDDENTGDSSDSNSESNDSNRQSSPEPQPPARSWMLGKMKPDTSNNEKFGNTRNPRFNKRNSLSDNEDKNDSSSSENSSNEENSKNSTTGESDSPKKHKKEDLRLLWERNPQIYGVRRSSRARKGPERLTTLQGSDDSGDGYRKKRSGKQWKRRESTDYTGTLTESESEEESASEFDSPPSRHKRSSRQRQSQNKRGPSKLANMRAVLEGKKRGSSSKSRRSNPKGGSHRNISETSSEDDEDEGRPQRTSTRNQNTKISYKEESDDETDSDEVMEIPEKEEELDTSECIERIMDFRIGKVSATGSSTTSYAVETAGNPNAHFDPDKEQGEEQYFISWKGWSHLHNTWESERTLREQKVRGIKKFENYIKKKEELDAWLRVASPEDAEYFLCQQELNRDLITTYQEVDRVIAKSRVKNQLGFWDYQIKWKGLPYAECTWEDGELVRRRFKKKIEEFEYRQENQKVPRRDSKGKPRIKFIPIKSPPHWLAELDGIELRDYQMDGINWLAHSWCRNNSVILADEMGLGKTIQSITFLSYLYHYHDVYGPFLIIVPLSTIAAWQKEFQTWAPFMNTIVYVGDATSRNVMKEVEWVFPNKKLKFNVVLTTYEILLKEKFFLGSHSWAVIAVDEAHRLKNEDSLLYRSLIEFKSHHRLLITGTPLQNSLKELWSLLHFLMPEKFDSWDDFEEVHTQERETGYTSLHKILQPYLLRRVKKDVEKSLPAKVERILRVEMSSIQKQYYRWILTKNYRELTKGSKGRVASFCNIVMELKKCCNHAFLTKVDEKKYFNSEEKLQSLIKSSGKMILLDKLLMRLRQDGHRVLIFSQMVRMLDLLQDYLIINRLPFQRLDGSIKGEIRRRALEHFNAPGSEDFCFLLSTRAGGLGINLASADTVIIFDSDWNPQNDLQAQARAHRIGQKNQVNIYRLVCVGSVEEDIIERAKKKMVLDHLVIQRMDTSGKTVLSKSNAPSASTGNPFNKEELSAILKFGAEEIFKETEDDNEPECDIDEILRRAETTTEQVETGAGGELLSAFKFATFTIDEDDDVTSPNVKNDEEDESRDGTKDWDEIIPEADRKMIEDEERKKQEAELYLPPRIRKSLKMNNGGSDSSEDSEDDGSEEEDGEDNDAGATKKRGRGRRAQKDEIPGFTTGEVRKFIKSFRKFGNPLERLDAIARDAELTVQSEADLRRLGEQLNDRLHEMLQAHNKNLLENMGNNEGSQHQRRRGPSFRIGGVSVSVKATMSCIEDLLPLVEAMPKLAEERKSFRLAIPVKPMRGCDCVWTSEDDSKLLIGIYEYGMGSWEQIQSDPSLELTKKILRPNNEKPQAKQLQSRVEFLMKLLKKTKELGRAASVVGSAAANAALSAAASRAARRMRGKKGEEDKADDPSGTKKRSRKIKSKARIDNGDDSDVDESVLNTKKKHTDEGRSRKLHKKTKSKDAQKNENEDTKENLSKNSQNMKEEKSRKLKKKHKKTSENSTEGIEAIADKKRKVHKPDKRNSQGPVHISVSSDPVPIGANEDFSGELDLETFKVCKERMRPVKKALKLLDKPPKSTENNAKAQTEHMKSCLLKIGDRVIDCLREFHDLETIKKWRRNLWIFVSKFTEFNAQRLHKLYKRAARKREEELSAKSKPNRANLGSGDHSTANQTSSKPSLSSNVQNSEKKNKGAISKKRSHSPVSNETEHKGGGDGPKRQYNPPEQRQWDRPEDRRASPGRNSRYFPPDYHRNVPHGERRPTEEELRYPPSGMPPHREVMWPRHGDNYRYHRHNDFRRREFEDPRRCSESPGRYAYPPRDERDFQGHPRRSPPPPFRGYRDVEHHNRHGDWDRYGHYPKYSPNSQYRHPLRRSRSPPHGRGHYREETDRPHPNVHSPGHVPSPNITEAKLNSNNLLQRDNKT